MNMQATLAQAMQLKESGNLEAAAQQFSAVLSAEPNQPEANFHLASILAHAGRVPEATTYMERAAAAAPEQPEVLAALAQLYGAAGRYDHAADLYEKIIASVPRGPATVQALLHHGVMRARANRYGDAAEDFKWVTQMSPDYAPGWHNLGNVMLKMKNRKGAVNAFRKALELEPGKPTVTYALGRALIWTKAYDEAIEVLTRAVGLAPERPQIISYKVLALRLAGRAEEADALEGLEDLIVSVDLAPPPGFSSIADWNEVLRNEIMNHHALAAAQGGAAQAQNKIQSFSDVFGQNKTPVLHAFEEQLRAGMAEAQAQMPDRVDHPLLQMKPRGYALNGTVGVIAGLENQREHNSPESWFSGTYYCAVPSEISGGGETGAGWTEFGGTPPDMPSFEDAPRRQVQPTAGRLIIGPSYVYRHRLPFQSTEPLVFCGFDTRPQAWDRASASSHS